MGMAFESLSERLGKAFKNIIGEGKLNEKNTNDMLREARMSSLEADVNYGVVKNFIARVKEQALGVEAMTSLNPGQMVVKIVHDETVVLLGSEGTSVNYKSSGIATVMMVGLQGIGKTAAPAKIANVMKKKQSRKPLLVVYDIIRPAAIEQLRTLGESIGVEVLSPGVETKALETAKQAMDHAKENDYDTMLFDTVGCPHIDGELIQGLPDIKAFVYLDDILLTVDTMTGQDIMNVADSFHEQLKVTGLVLAKLDGDSRGDGILFARFIIQVPAKFVSLGEKTDDLDAFHPDRMADRILGMGDIMSLVKQAQDKMDIEASTRSANHMMSGQFTLTDMLMQFQQLEKMRSLGGMMKLIPGTNQLAGRIDEAKAGNKMKKSTAVIQSMAMEERESPNILRAPRKNRIAKGSGTTVTDVDRLLNEYEGMKQIMRQMGAMIKSGRMSNMGDMGTTGIMKNMHSMNKTMRQGGK